MDQKRLNARHAETGIIILSENYPHKVYASLTACLVLLLQEL